MLVQMVNRQLTAPDGSQQNALQPGRDFVIDEVKRMAALTEAGMSRILTMIGAALLHTICCHAYPRQNAPKR